MEILKKILKPEISLKYKNIKRQCECEYQNQIRILHSQYIENIYILMKGMNGD